MIVEEGEAPSYVLWRCPMAKRLRTEFPPLPRGAVRACLVGLAASLIALPALAGSVSYAYDALGRLKSATYSNGVVITYSYDAAGNRTAQVTTGVP